MRKLPEDFPNANLRPIGQRVALENEKSNPLAVNTLGGGTRRRWRSSASWAASLPGLWAGTRGRRPAPEAEAGGGPAQGQRGALGQQGA